jgi:hypothetical protein
VKFVFAASMRTTYGQRLLTEAAVAERLLSFHEVRDLSDKRLQGYVRSGLYTEPKLC